MTIKQTDLAATESVHVKSHETEDALEQATDAAEDGEMTLGLRPGAPVWEPDDNNLPEGLAVWAHPLDDALLVKDAQDHLWVTIHNRASGDPAEWPTEITQRIMVALGIYNPENSKEGAE